MTLRRQLEVYRNARKSEALDVRVLDAAITRIRFDRALMVTITIVSAVGVIASVATAALAP